MKFMFAVFGLGSKQYKVVENTTVDVDFLSHLNENDEVTFDKVITYAKSESEIVTGDETKNITVKGKVLRHFRTPKIMIFKKEEENIIKEGWSSSRLYSCSYFKYLRLICSLWQLKVVVVVGMVEILKVRGLV